MHSKVESLKSLRVQPENVVNLNKTLSNCNREEEIWNLNKVLEKSRQGMEQFKLILKNKPKRQGGCGDWSPCSLVEERRRSQSFLKTETCRSIQLYIENSCRLHGNTSGQSYRAISAPDYPWLQKMASSTTFTVVSQKSVSGMSSDDIISSWIF